MMKRFEYRQGRHDRAASKIDNPVRFPVQLNMLPYTNRVRRDNRESLELERSCTYDLLSVVVHVGEIETGHYVSYCRVGDQVSSKAISTSPIRIVLLISPGVVQIQRSQSGTCKPVRGSGRKRIPPILHYSVTRVSLKVWSDIKMVHSEEREARTRQESTDTGAFTLGETGGDTETQAGMHSSAHSLELSSMFSVL